MHSVTPIVFLDMDGVIADFVGAALTSLGVPSDCIIDQWNMAECLGISDEVFWQSQDAVPSFWLDVPIYEGGIDFVRRLESLPIDLRYATSPSRHIRCASDKIRWLDRYLGTGHGGRAIITRAKHLLAGPGRMLIDDYPVNCAAFTDFGGASVCFPQSWNTTTLLPSMAERYDYIFQSIVSWINGSADVPC